MSEPLVDGEAELKNLEKQEKFEDSTILVVDDNQQNLELIVAYLDTLGCKVRTAVNGLLALEEVKETSFDLILLDIMMPKMSGFEV